ncbi:adenylate kinase protein [Marine Group I thaumarchaeote SCGC RSA3]|uniref:Putative adenylate kinase n=3 Tax=Marine Group I TaxID=905826 RepID=A0A081RLY8_9ARCH|nr:adenylate kinase protein [Marine Group I thaumarchaeote SCGC AAA799-N04]KFM15135.1 adenylate kinase protein [Marine Group I thaumarchaeote SCGC AAA799-D11]KFM16362.1 adenylate kinase protein [Marine Group I thaumarchaeote SCGC RSA3]
MSIVITGTPGVGKHTIGEKLAQKSKLDIIDINEIAKNSGLFEQNDESNDIDTEKLQEIIKEKISNKCIIIGHLAPYVLEKDKISMVIVLRRNPYDLIKVYDERGYSDKKSKENASSEVLGVITYDAKNQFQDKVVQINVTERTIQEVLEKVESVISGNTNSEEVDWLDLVTTNNDLKKFFVD